jgi:pSer/pThr/pTyr-binding forkhead associated (FHA) protein
MIRCVHCNMENEPIFTYCLNCGKPLEQSLSGFKPGRGAAKGGAAQCRLISVRSDGAAGPEFPLKDGVNTIGRQGPEVVVPDDPRVADRHATIDVGRDVAFLEDAGTRHGTFVRVTGQKALADGDQIRIGHALYQIQIGSPKPEPSTDGATWLGTPGLATDFFGRLLRLGPSDAVMEAHLLRAPETTLGRTSGDILLPDDPFVSSRHASFLWSGTGSMLKDQGSTNGCYLRIRGRTAIEDGTHVLLGHHLFEFKRAQ